MIGRRLPSEKDENPTLYRMRVFAPDEVAAKSRFFYFLKKLKKVKKANGEIVFCGVVSNVIICTVAYSVYHSQSLVTTLSTHIKQMHVTCCFWL